MKDILSQAEATDTISGPTKFAALKQTKDITRLLYNAQIVGGYSNYDLIYERLYKSMCPSSGVTKTSKCCMQGAIFNVKFSPDGKVLVAACENSCLQFYDPVRCKKTCEVIQAHSGCVNCIHFLNQCTFATGSDDKTIRVWDLRKAAVPLHVLKGHKGWVKNIGFDKNSGILMSSSFDGTVRIWDFDETEEDGEIRNEIVIKQPDMIRAKLSNDCTKLFLTLTDGSGIMVFHDLNLRTMSMDYSMLRPFPYRNKLEMLPDCPHSMWCIYSIDVHPFDWCIAVRFVNQNDTGEEVATYDIQSVHTGDCSYKCEHQSSITHYIQESKFADGFIKEISFSPDGRILSSPFRKGVRLLAFNQSCDELCDCVPKSCTQLSVVNTISSHKRSVLTSAFSPITQLLVTGCRGGEVHFHSPKL